MKQFFADLREARERNQLRKLSAARIVVSERRAALKVEAVKLRDQYDALWYKYNPKRDIKPSTQTLRPSSVVVEATPGSPS